MIRVVIADDHPIVRAGLKQLLSEEPDILVAGEAGDGAGLMETLRKTVADAVILDISMPGNSGLETLRQLKLERPWLPVLVLSVYPEDQYAVRVLKAGASGYLMKDSAPEELILALRKVLAGGKYITVSFAERLADTLCENSQAFCPEKLSDRELEILCFLASGKSLTWIAGELSLSVKTVSTYRSRILDKSGLGSNAELTRYALDNRLIP